MSFFPLFLSLCELFRCLGMCLFLPERRWWLNYLRLGEVLYATGIPFLGEAYNVRQVLHYMVESFLIMSWGVHFLQRRRITT